MWLALSGTGVVCRLMSLQKPKTAVLPCTAHPIKTTTKITPAVVHRHRTSTQNRSILTRFHAKLINLEHAVNKLKIRRFASGTGESACMRS